MQLKPITKEGVPAALQKAERYRLLNDSSAAESICLDILQVEPENQSALVTLLLSISDQFAEEHSDGVHRAREVLPRLTDDYKRAYYAGIICERRAQALLHRSSLGAGGGAGGGFCEARWGGGGGGRGGRVVSRGDVVVRARGVAAACRQRRGDPAMEYVRSPPRPSRAERPIRATGVRARARGIARRPHSCAALRLPRRADSCSARNASPGRRSSVGRTGTHASPASPPPPSAA